MMVVCCLLLTVMLASFVLKDKDDTDFLRGYGYQTHVLRPDWEFRFNEKGFGKSFKDKLRRPLPIWVWALRAFKLSLSPARQFVPVT